MLLPDEPEEGDAKARRWLSDVLLERRANTAVAFTVSDEAGSVDFACLTDAEFESFNNLHDKIMSGDPVSADDALAYVGLMAKALRSSERPDREWDD